MAIPTRTEAASILLGLNPSERLVAHCAAVAEIAAFLAAAMVRRGVAVNSGLVEAAALLHDIDKALPADDPHRLESHGKAGATWLTEHGYAELAHAVAIHPVMTLSEAASWDAWTERAGPEGRVVAYADKRATRDIVTLDQRLARWEARYPGSASLRLARERAERLESEICATAGLAPEEVARLPWVSDALQRAA